MRYSILLASLLSLSACAKTTYDSTSSPAVSEKLGMVVTANPHATKAGADILRAGGSAVDAAIAIEAVLSLVEPQSSGLGGGAFMVHFENKSNVVTVYDGRETAPSGVSETMFLNDEGKSIGFLNAKNSGLSTGVPGVVSMLQLAHTDHGKLKWGAQFDRARQLAQDGFAISPRLHGLVSRFGKYIPDTKDEGPVDAFNYFFDKDGQPRAIGDRIINPAYARTLELIAEDPRNFYRGEVAKSILQQTALAPRAGTLSIQDLANYSAQKRQPLCAPYRDMTLCGPPPPSSWVAVGAIVGLLEHAERFGDQGDADAINWAKFAQAQQLAYADRDQYVGDSEFVDVPLQGMLSKDYLKQRAKLISKDQTSVPVSPGDPWQFEPSKKVAYGDDSTVDMAGTTHFVVIDREGDVVSMTASVESVFGSTRMAGGMFLNNQLTDFSFQPKDKLGRPQANRVEPNKRPRSSMSPTIVLDKDGEFLMATGSPGGNSIIAYTAKTLVGVLDWGLTPQQAVDLPNMVARGDKVRIEKDRASPELIGGLKSFGLNVTESKGENSGLSVIYRQPDGTLLGGVDLRREGVIETVVFE